NEISQKYFERSLADRYRTDCTPVPSFHLAGESRKKRAGGKKKRSERVVFVEKKFSDRVRCFNNMIFPLTWYFEFQKMVVDLFAEKKDFEFIYKHARGQIWAERSILKYIRSGGCAHIHVFDGHFTETLKFADRVIMDHPSTALFETAAAGIPVLSLYADYYNVLGPAKKVFGRSLREFSSEEEALSIIEEFLGSDPGEYTVDLPLTGGNFADSFSGIMAQKV
ncbi:MAG: hypothetical protein KAS86_05070, partial [Candidatus Omnitrophica bacterium]|nr:hypothetical protein [Candidatus Omnitrophota bacterium]